MMHNLRGKKYFKKVKSTTYIFSQSQKSEQAWILFLNVVTAH